MTRGFLGTHAVPGAVCQNEAQAGKCEQYDGTYCCYAVNGSRFNDWSQERASQSTGIVNETDFISKTDFSTAPSG